MVGRNAFHTATRHCHSRIGFETGHAQERNQCTRYVFTDSATVGIVHLGIVKCKALSFSHGYTGITDIISHPMSQHGNLFHFGLLAFYQFIHFFLRFGQWGKTTIVFIHFVEPQRFVFPLRSGRHHQFGSCIEKIHHIRLSAERHYIIHGKSVYLAIIFITHGRSTFPLIELELQFFLHRNSYFINFTHGGGSAPERNNIIKLPAHRRDKTRIVFITGSKQRISEPLLGYLILHNITGLQSADFEHYLSRSPVNSPGRSSIITGFLYIQFVNLAIGTIDGYTLKLGIGGQRVIIVFNYPVSHCPSRSLYFNHFTHSKRALPGRLDRYQRAIQQCHVIGCFISLSLRSIFIRFPALSERRSRSKKETS